LHCEEGNFSSLMALQFQEQRLVQLLNNPVCHHEHDAGACLVVATSQPASIISTFPISTLAS
jgi:hypothetical protein